MQDNQWQVISDLIAVVHNALLETQQDVEKASPVTGAAVTPIKEFKPTEQIEADSAVSFPVDI